MLRWGRTPKAKKPHRGYRRGFLLWRRPTLARPVAVLPSGLQRFTSVFGMGTGGATALLSPEADSTCSLLSQRREREAESLETRTIRSIVKFRKNTIFDGTRKSQIKEPSDSLTSTYRFSKFRLRTADATTSEPSLRSFRLLCLPLRKSAERLNRKVKDQAERVISTPELNTLLCLHPEPINVVVYHDPSGRSHLGIGLALRCFQRLSFPNIATQRCR